MNRLPTVPLAQCSVKEGMVSDVFRAAKASLVGIDPSLCMSLIAPQRSLDLVFESPADFKQWHATLVALVRSFEKNGVFMVDSKV